jgi:class 3 adenylate cyclase/predicted ATPase
MDVGSWLRSLGLGQYEANFRDNKIDADLLPRLTVDDLKDIGVSVVGDRRRLLDAIAALAGAGPPADVPTSSTKSAASKGLQASAERRPITVMFCDLVGSTSLAAKLDAEDWRNLVNAYLDEASKAVTDFGGHVLKRLGDGLMALFGYPKAQENDAERAVRAALVIQRALAALNARNAKTGAPELSARIGIETGPVVVDATGEVFGDAPNVAARVQAAAEPGSVLVTGSVQRQVAGLFVVEEKGAYELKGVAQLVSLYRVVRASGGGRKGGARALTSFVGREEDIGTLLRRWDRVRAGEGQFVQIVGEPGLGKSRLVEEFHSRLGETPHTWVEWNSSQLLQNTPLHPVAEWGRARFGSQDVAAERRLADLEATLAQVKLDVQETATLLAPLLDIPLPAERAPKFGPEELRTRQLAAMVALLLAGARTQPVVLAFEDLHWADPTSLDLIQALAERGAQAPLLVVATTRPEFRAPWGMRSHHAVVALAPLDRTEVRRMVGEIAAQHALPQEVVERVSERTGGVPLFVEEVTRLLLERGDTGSQAVPPTLQQSLAARLDRLGPAREVAQIGAVLGRYFVYGLLRDVAEMDEQALRASLDRLADADLLFVEGAPPEANYRFKHALIQDAAYESLLKSRRQVLHRRAAEALREANAEPEAIAHHFTEAGLDDLAIEWWGKAGDQALRRSAFQEAIAHLGRAIAMADKGAVESVPPATISDTKLSGRVRLQADYAQAVMYSKGFAADETKAAFERTGDLATQAEFPGGRFPALYGQFVWCLFRGEPRTGRDIAQLFLREAEAQGGVAETGVAHRLMGLACAYCGDLAEARRELELAIDSHGRERDSEVIDKFGQDTGVAGRAYLALVSWLMGDFHRARQCIQEATHLSGELDHLPSGIVALGYKVIVESAQNDLESILVDGENLLKISQQHGMDFYGALCRVYLSWARGRLGDARSGADELRNSLAEYTGQGNGLAMPWFLGFLAELEAVAGDFEPGLAAISEGLASAQDGGQHYVDAFLHRLRGDILLKHTPADPAAAEYAYQTAIAIAQQQGARSYKLFASLSLAKLYQSTGRPVEAHTVLEPALVGFSPTPEMPEIAEARALLAKLAETDEVKSAEGQRQRRLHLQTAYGQAVMWAKGFAAEETKAAFARASELAANTDNFAARFATGHSQWASAMVRGEQRRARVLASSFLKEAEDAGRLVEVGVARRGLAQACYLSGEFLEARTHCERALDACDPEREKETRERFTDDTGPIAISLLAMTRWQLGEVERARELIDEANRRARDLGHAPSMAHPLNWKSRLEILRGDAAAALSAAETLEGLCREYGMPFWRIRADLDAEWARGHLHDAAAGVEGLRRALAAAVGQGMMWDAWFYTALLAELEARTVGADSALKRIDEALLLARQVDDRCDLAFPHILRGELLLKRNPSNPASAEEAFRAALDIAKEQGARSWALRAALSLAKLYQSTTRPAEAHATLAPALDGFAPTPEMPEIAEAQALVSALAETKEVKAAEAQHEQRLRLHTGYSQAMMMTKGFAAGETKAAFARVAELAETTHGFPERFASLLGQFAAASTAGELRSAQELALTLRREAEDAGRVMEADIANDQLGLIAYWRGDFVEARTHCERGLDARGDPKFQELFGDGSTYALSFLAATMWQLGEVERARELIDTATRRAAETGHIGVIANALFWKSYLEVWRGDPLATLSAAEALERVARKHGMLQYINEAELHSGWARGRIDDPMAGAARVRAVLGAFVDQGVKVNLGFYSGLLAELEAETLGADSAVARIEEAFALSNDVEHRCSLPFVHRLRGEILLKRDPPDPALAEEAFVASIGIAKEQGARSPVLLASLSLAKFYQSTDRPADAHAVLAPALEGFAPTPEMPEIAEAQALLVAIEAAAHVRRE